MGCRAPHVWILTWEKVGETQILMTTLTKSTGPSVPGQAAPDVLEMYTLDPDGTGALTEEEAT